jgi:PP-loop superfamily ATP-utilizing enzyme
LSEKVRFRECECLGNLREEKRSAVSFRKAHKVRIGHEYNLGITKPLKSWNLRKEKISESQKQKNLGILDKENLRIIEGEKSWNLGRKKISESSNARNFRILEEEKYLGILGKVKHLGIS